jgi:SAM-dependent methyltransferase
MSQVSNAQLSLGPAGGVAIGPCRICGRVLASRYEFSRLAPRPEAEGAWRVGWCCDCDAGFLVPRPSVELAAALHSGRYFADYNAARPEGGGPSLLDRVRSHLAWRLDRGWVRDPAFYASLTGSATAAVCDLGCGNGDLIESLARHGFRVVGVEPSPHARENCRAHGLEVHEGTAEDLPPKVAEGSFDLVTMNHVLEHCHDPAQAVANALRLARAGGRVIIEVPNCASFAWAERGPAWFHFDVGRHVNYFTPRALARLLERQGAVVESAFFYAYLVHFLPGRIATEAALWDLRAGDGPAANLEGIARPSRAAAWRGLFRSAALAPERKYECQGIIARKG